MLLLENMENLIPNADLERGVNKALVAFNRGHLVSHLKEVAAELGVRIFEINLCMLKERHVWSVQGDFCWSSLQSLYALSDKLSRCPCVSASVPVEGGETGHFTLFRVVLCRTKLLREKLSC